MMRNHARRATRQRGWRETALTAPLPCPGDPSLPAAPLIAAHPPAPRRRDTLDRIDALEMPVVVLLAGLTRFRAVRGLTLAVNALGNGWIYLPLVALLLLSEAPHAGAIAAASVAATAGSHALYAVLKRRVARLRPFERNPSLTPLARALDRYAFPSGHCMTLAAVLGPVVHAAPACWLPACAALLVLAWCRIAAAHHYPSDVVAGTCLGMAVAMPFALVLVPA
ncbi:MAG TPA: phosphatase PAP2 family protein [Paucimonas sp.]|nr:phosphatase PAP2 family protein [Paucimonas sp.]